MTAHSDTPAPETGAGPAEPPAPPERPGGPTGDIVVDSPRWWARHIWWVSLAAALGGLAIIWFAMPHEREIESAWHLIVKVITFGFVVAAVASFPWVARQGPYWLLYIPFVFFTAYLFPRIGYFYFVDVEKAEAGSFYTHQFLLSYPGIVLTAAAAYRLGGGSPGRCMKIAATGMLIIFSGLLDFMWWLVNPVEVPELIDAPHITILTGGPISFGATILFALAHVPIIVGLNLLPLDRWFGRLLGSNPTPAASR